MDYVIFFFNLNNISFLQMMKNTSDKHGGLMILGGIKNMVKVPKSVGDPFNQNSITLSIKGNQIVYQEGDMSILP